MDVLTAIDGLLPYSGYVTMRRHAHAALAAFSAVFFARTTVHGRQAHDRWQPYAYVFMRTRGMNVVRWPGMANTTTMHCLAQLNDRQTLRRNVEREMAVMQSHRFRRRHLPGRA
jgi:hypothetical protein